MKQVPEVATTSIRVLSSKLFNFGPSEFKPNFIARIFQSNIRLIDFIGVSTVDLLRARVNNNKESEPSFRCHMMEGLVMKETSNR